MASLGNAGGGGSICPPSAEFWLLADYKYCNGGIWNDLSSHRRHFSGLRMDMGKGGRVFFNARQHPLSISEFTVADGWLLVRSVGCKSFPCEPFPGIRVPSGESRTYIEGPLTIRTLGAHGTVLEFIGFVHELPPDYMVWPQTKLLPVE